MRRSLDTWQIRNEYSNTRDARGARSVFLQARYGRIVKGRAALSLPPTYRTVTDGQDAYVDALQLRPLAKQHGRYWAFHKAPTTVALPGSRFAKSLGSFTSHTNEESFRELLGEYAENNCPRPSGYADVFHQIFKSPRVGWSVNALLAPCLAGGWQAALSAGVHRHRVYKKYDMRSAYLWAATLGLPETSTYTRSLTPWRSDYDGVFRIKLTEPSAGAPFPFNQARECIATNCEIDTYGLKIASVVDGVIWKRSIPGDDIVACVRRVSTWKQAGRSYWGRWGQMQKVDCTANGKTWQLPNLALNVPWAHLIIARVRMRLWEFSKNAVHVYVDSVITTDELPPDTGALGDWRLEKTYPNGVFVKGPGQYGDINALKMEKYAGLALDSPQRYTTMAAVRQVGPSQPRLEYNGKRENRPSDVCLF